MRIEEGIQAALVAAGIASYYEFMPQGVVYPALTFQRVSTVRGDLLSELDTFTTVRFQFDAYADNLTAVKGLADQVRALFDGFAGNLSGVTVQNVKMENETDLSILEGDKETRRTSLDFFFILHE